ncbi:hypothetical protein ACLBX9_27850 [Methylobacterium sp. A49B]
MAAELDTPQAFDLTHDWDALQALSHTQNGFSRVVPTFDKGGTLNGFVSYYPIDATDYAAAAAAALVATKTALKAQVDARAEQMRLTLITPGSGQAMEYQEAFNEAVLVTNALAANAGATIDPAKYLMLASSIGFDTDPQTGRPTTDVPGEARAVLAAYDAYQRAGAAIRGARLKGKADIDAAANDAAAQAAFAAIVWPALA